MTPDSKPLSKTLHAALGTVLVMAGCGERAFLLDPGSIERSSSEVLHAGFRGAEVELHRFSSVCAKSSNMSLTAEVSAEVEFAGDRVASIDSPCAGAPTPTIDVSIERDAVVFDFAQVADAGRFPAADFDGFILDLTVTSENALLVYAQFDEEATSVDVYPDDLAFESDRIEINLEGVAYEPGSMLKVGLWFLDVPAVSDET